MNVDNIKKEKMRKYQKEYYLKNKERIKVLNEQRIKTVIKKKKKKKVIDNSDMSLIVHLGS